MADYKLIYLARRNPALRAEDFPEAWREHSRLSSKFATTFGSHFRSVHQCVKAYELDTPPAFRNEYDGCALIGMKSWDDLVAARSHPRAQNELKKDEERVFADYVDPWTMAAEERVLREGPACDHMMLSFLKPLANLSGSAFDKGLEELAGALLECSAARESAVTVNRVVDPSAVYGFGAVIEVWFKDASALSCAAQDSGLSRILAAQDIADQQASALLLARLNLKKTMNASPEGKAAWKEEQG